jgi:hypothetical protein
MVAADTHTADDPAATVTRAATLAADIAVERRLAADSVAVPLVVASAAVAEAVDSVAEAAEGAKCAPVNRLKRTGNERAV